MSKILLTSSIFSILGVTSPDVCTSTFSQVYVTTLFTSSAFGFCNTYTYLHVPRMHAVGKTEKKHTCFAVSAVRLVWCQRLAKGVYLQMNPYILTVTKLKFTPKLISHHLVHFRSKSLVFPWPADASAPVALTSSNM